MAGAGMARAIHPVFSPFDGDIVIAASTGEGPLAAPATLGRMGSLASDLVVRAIVRAVRPPGAGGAPG
jgi:L-aminopeptidase/D-esterase-like protein